MVDFIDSNGLINSRPDEVHSENSPLISLEYILVRKLLGKHTPSMNQALYNFIEEVKIREGLYNQRDFIVGNGCPEDYVSNDQLSTFVAYSYSNGWNWHKNIWQEIKRQKFRYDNINPDNPSWGRVVHPRDIIYYGILNDNWIANKLFPVFRGMTHQTCARKTVTSGKLLAFMRVVSVMDNKPKFKKLFIEMTNIIRNNDTMLSWKKPFEIYYPDPNHPIRKVIEENKDAEWLN